MLNYNAFVKDLFHIIYDKIPKNMIFKMKTNFFSEKGTLKKYKNNGHVKA